MAYRSLKTKTLRCLDTSDYDYPYTQHHTQTNVPILRCCENLKTRNSVKPNRLHKLTTILPIRNLQHSYFSSPSKNYVSLNMFRSRGNSESINRSAIWYQSSVRGSSQPKVSTYTEHNKGQRGHPYL